MLGSVVRRLKAIGLLRKSLCINILQEMMAMRNKNITEAYRKKSEGNVVCVTGFSRDIIDNQILRLDPE